MLITLAYISHTPEPMSEPELMTLLDFCRQSNQRQQVTGLLLYDGGAFMQVLEGPETVVRDLFARIRRDERHERVTQVYWRAISARAFPEWRMAFRRMPEAADDQIPAYSDFMQATSKSPFDESRINQTLSELLRHFRDNAADDSE